MPATTPNRLYPYSIPADPADVPGALQALAEAVNDDVAALDAIVRPRLMARVSATSTVNISGLTAGQLLPWESIDFNTASSVGQRAIGPITGDGTTITVLEAGFYFMLATCIYRSQGPGTPVDQVGIVIQVNGVSEGRFMTHDTQFIAESTRLADASHGALLSAGDTIGLLGLHDQNVTDTQGYLARSLTILRMTQF